jgi:hypothetical protein
MGVVIVHLQFVLAKLSKGLRDARERQRCSGAASHCQQSQ